MKQTYLTMVILYCLHRINGQRTIYSILHLLNGKKSAQTIQDAHFFRLTSLFHTFSFLNRAELEQIIASLTKHGYTIQISEQSYRLTTIGVKQMTAFFEQYPIPQKLNGWKYHHITDLFWERLSLAIQVISQLNHHEPKYLPIQKKKELHLWLKRFLSNTRLNRVELATSMYQELVKGLDTNEEINPEILIRRLTGFQIIGLTSSQTAEKLQMDEMTYHIQFLGVLHYMLEMVEKNPNEFSILRQIIVDQISFVPLTQSTKKTYSFLSKGFSIDDIARIRKLKRNTIEDHIVEIALNIHDFDISSFVMEEKQQKIANAIQAGTSKQLKHIREQVPEANYFEIRLVMAQAGDQQ